MSKRFNVLKISLSILFLAVFLFLIALFSSAIYTRNKHIENYNKGVYLLQEGRYTEAIDSFRNIPNCTQYKDISELFDEYQIPVCPNCGLPLE